MSRTFEVLSATTPAPVSAQQARVPAPLADAANNILKASEGPASIVKFKKGHFYAGESEIAVGREFVAYCGDWAQGWIKFENGEVTDRRFGRVAEGFHPPERDELGNADQSNWPSGLDGAPSDPWVYQHYLPLEDAETGERFLFVTSSAGGSIAVRGLCNRYARSIARGLPTIRLSVGEFTSKKYGATPRPDFPIVGWESDGGMVEIRPPSSVKLDDEIPF